MRRRKDIQLIERPHLSMHLDYDYLTVGELGNILIRLQATLRSMAGLGRGEYAGKYTREQPRFVTSSVITKQSIDVELLLTILFFAAQAPGAIDQWSRFAGEAFRRLKMALLAIIQGRVESPQMSLVDEAFRIEVTRGRIDFSASRQLVEKELSDDQRKKLGDLLWSLTGPANKIVIGDEESEVSIYGG